MKGKWLVVAVCEDEEARRLAVDYCDQLIQRFWNERSFDIKWWHFSNLQETSASKEAAEKAAEADLILFASRSDAEIPIHVKAWVETWLNRRGDREGILVGLQNPESVPSTGATQTELYLRNLAHRGRLDFLTEMPQSLSDPIPESLDSYSQRANEVTSTLDRFLRKPSASSARSS